MAKDWTSEENRDFLQKLYTTRRRKYFEQAFNQILHPMFAFGNLPMTAEELKEFWETPSTFPRLATLLMNLPRRGTDEIFIATIQLDKTERDRPPITQETRAGQSIVTGLEKLSLQE